MRISVARNYPTDVRTTYTHPVFRVTVGHENFGDIDGSAETFDDK